MKKVLTFFLMIVLLSNSIFVKIGFADDIRTTTPNKIWKVTFTTPMNLNDQTKNYIHLIHNGSNVDFTSKIDDSKEIISIYPSQLYTVGETYSIVVDKDFSTVKGISLTQQFTFSFSIIDPSDVSHDTTTLRNNAEFKVPVYGDIYWVPANALGKSNLNNTQITKLNSDPEQIKNSIKNLYDLIEFIQIKNVKPVDGNSTKISNNISWEYSRAISEDITSNSANCLNISNLANYILSGDYDEVGFIEICQLRGGHIFNYVKQKGIYYIFDLTSYMKDDLAVGAETGHMVDYSFENHIANVHETTDLKTFATYYERECNYTSNTIVLTYSNNTTLSVGSDLQEGSTRTYYFDKKYQSNIKILLDDPTHTVNIKYANEF